MQPIRKGVVSCIMPTYNRADIFLTEAIRHAQKQTYEQWELIVIDDGSSDDTYDVVKQFFDDERIIYSRLYKNSGCVSIPRAIGIMLARGEFLAHWDDDIIHFPMKLEVLVKALNDNTNTDLAYGFRRAERMHSPGEYDIVGPAYYDPTIRWGVDGSQFIYRSSVYKHIPLSLCKRGCDWEIMKLIWRNNPGFVMVSDLVSQYNWHGGNRSLDDKGTKQRIYHPSDFEEYFTLLGNGYTYSLEDF